MATSNNPHLTSKLDGFGTTIFAEMSALATQTGSINLGQGFPDTDGPAVVRDAAVDAIRTGKGNQYPPGPGIPELRLAIARHQHDFYGIEIDSDAEVLVTCGATEALAASLLSLLETGDECIVFEPFYDSYPAGIALAGARMVPVRLHAPTFQPDPDELRAAVGPNTRVIVVNSPHNPTGSMLTHESLTMISALAVEHDLVVIADEAYEHLTFDGRAHTPIATFPGMADRTITIGSAGKSLSFTGWKVGWATGHRQLVSAVRTSKQFLTYVASGPFQYAVAVGLGLGPSYFSEFAATLQAKRDRLQTGLAAAGFTTFTPSGTYFITTEISAMANVGAMQFCRELPARCGVVAIPNSVFYANPADGERYVRFAFCKQDSVLDEAVDRLSRFVT